MQREYYCMLIKQSFALLILALFMACANKPVTYNEEIEIIEEFSTLQERLDSDKDKIWVVNFWATTCPPCLIEMPHFKKLQDTFAVDEVKVLLVSTDRANDHAGRVLPFVEQHLITPEVMHLVDENYSAWTDDVDPSWYGALPATLILKGSKRSFKFGMFENFEELQDSLNRVR